MRPSFLLPSLLALAVVVGAAGAYRPPLYFHRAGPTAHKKTKPKKPPKQNLSPEDCRWKFAGTSRKAVKLRTVLDASNYTRANNGDPITVEEFFALVCPLDTQVPPVKKISEKKAMKGIETITVTVRGFLLGARFERSGDHDFHVEIGGVSNWNTDHLIVEVPPGPAYCNARKAIWDTVKRGLTDPNSIQTSDRWILDHPQEILVTGYVFLDSVHATHGNRDFCHFNGGRGIQKSGGKSKVRGLWEVHPVTDIAPAP